MKICGLQKVSFVDYNEHICATIFTSGCNFACPFCHNAGLVKETEKEISQQEILEYLESRKNLIDSVCVSGGEPTLHPDLPEFLTKIKNLGFLIKLDTNGSNLNALRILVEKNLVDYIAMDIKNSLNKYSYTTGNNFQFNVKETISYIMNSGVDYEFRTTLVKDYHTEIDMIGISEMLSGAKRYYLQKFVDSGNCINSDLEHIDIDEAKKFQQIMQKTVPNTFLRGY